MAREKETLGIGGDQDYDSMIGWEPKHIKRLKEKARKHVPKAPPEILYCRTMNKWMQTVRAPSVGDALFGPFWSRNELAIMFSAAGVGKSLLATQIAEYLARGLRMGPFDAAEICRPERVLYLDFELNREQLLSRYSVRDGSGPSGRDVFSFSSNIVRTENYWNGQIAQGYESFAEMLFDDVLDLVGEHEISTLIVDNITFLDRSSTANTDISLGIMRRLNELKRSEFLSILVLAHAAKPTGQPGPLTDADLQGSVNLCNFADSVFALGRSVASPDLRYLKQIKSRSARIEYGGRNVPVLELGKFDLAAAMGTVATERAPVENFLGYRFRRFGSEREFRGLGPIGLMSARSDLRSTARRLVRQGMPITAIAAEIGVSRSTVHRYVGRRK